MLVEGVKGSGSPIVLSPVHEVIQEAFPECSPRTRRVRMAVAVLCRSLSFPRRDVSWETVLRGRLWDGGMWLPRVLARPGEAGPSGGTAVSVGRRGLRGGPATVAWVLCEDLLLASWLRVLRQVSCLCLLICEAGVGGTANPVGNVKWESG